MKSLLKSIIFFGLILFTKHATFAQDADKTVSITVSGNGKTQEEAKNVALRSAIEQAFGAFISSNTEILNDQLVADQITSVSNGNINSFSVLNESQLPDSSWGVTLKALVSVSKLTSFAEAKGVAIEVKGGIFALNIKQQLINEKSEEKVIYNLIGVLHETFQVAFNFELKNDEPKSMDASSVNWELNVYVSAICNDNFTICSKYLFETIKSTSLSEEEKNNYISLNKNIYPIIIKYEGLDYKFYLRSKKSIDLMKSLLSNWEFYNKLFSINIDEFKTDGYNQEISKNKLLRLSFIDYKYNNTSDKPIEILTIEIPKVGEIVSEFNLKLKRNLSQIEQMKNLSVKPIGLFSKFANGGYVIAENKYYKSVLYPYDIGQKYGSETLDQYCDKNEIDGYKDWYLPTAEKMDEICKNYINKGIGGFDFIKCNYLTSDVYPVASDQVYSICAKKQVSRRSFELTNYRLVRTFIKEKIKLEADSGWHHYLGENYLGGIIFYLNKNESGIEYGRILSIKDGLIDTTGGWRLPSISELKYLNKVLYFANVGLSKLKDADPIRYFNYKSKDTFYSKSDNKEYNFFLRMGVKNSEANLAYPNYYYKERYVREF